MTFAYDVRANLVMLVDLLNTASAVTDERDGLTTTVQLREFAARHDFSGPLRSTKADVEAIRRLRERFTSVLTSSAEANAALLEPDDSVAAPCDRAAVESGAERAEGVVVDAINLTLQEAGTIPQLVRHDEWDWHLHAAGRDANLADRVAADVALVLIDLIRSDDLARLRLCAAEDCRAFLADFSRNRSKRFCDFRNCANRTHVAAFRARQSAADEENAANG